MERLGEIRRRRAFDQSKLSPADLEAIKRPPVKVGSLSARAMPDRPIYRDPKEKGRNLEFCKERPDSARRKPKNVATGEAPRAFVPWC